MWNDPHIVYSGQADRQTVTGVEYWISTTVTKMSSISLTLSTRTGGLAKSVHSTRQGHVGDTFALLCNTPSLFSRLLFQFKCIAYISTPREINKLFSIHSTPPRARAHTHTAPSSRTFNSVAFHDHTMEAQRSESHTADNSPAHLGKYSCLTYGSLFRTHFAFTIWLLLPHYTHARCLPEEKKMI